MHSNHTTEQAAMLQPSATNESLDYTHDSHSETYLDLGAAGRTVVTASSSSVNGHLGGGQDYHNNPYHDATKTVREMHLALLYLLSNPEEFHRTLQAHPPRDATTLQEWNAEYNDTMTEDGSSTVVSTTIDNDQNGNHHYNVATNMSSSLNNSHQYAAQLSPSGANQSNSIPLPLIVFADDAEVVLPQAHTASQLFGLERIEGIELEAAAGIVSLSQLFLRWLALMPGGDHLNIIDPPGLTVMRIAGGRYRVTAAHRVIWTWMNEFAALSDHGGSIADGGGSTMNGGSGIVEDEVQLLRVGDLVTMTIVDVFETDNHGKLLSYCPTFDNRAVHKTNPKIESIRKSSSKIMNVIARVQRSPAAQSLMTNVKSVAGSVGNTVKQRVVDGYYNSSSSPRYNNSTNNNNNKNNGSSAAPAKSDATSASVTNLQAAKNAVVQQQQQDTRGEGYISDDCDEPEDVI